MVEIRPARMGEEGQWRALWREVFGDGDILLDAFSRCCPPEEMMLLWEGGRLCSMLALPAVEVVSPQGGVATGAYVYALATPADLRGRGYARMLLRWVDGALAKRGVDCVTVVPAQESLHRFFGTAGFSPCFSTRTVTLECSALPAPPAGDRAEEITPEEYNTLRDRLLAGMSGVRYPHRLVAFQQALSHLSGGGLYQVTVGGVEGCAAVERGEDILVVKELLVPPAAEKAAAAVLAQCLPARQIELRTPEGRLPEGRSRPFGMMKWLVPLPGELWADAGYMGLGFD